MARIIAVANQKGGVAKTTTAITLAAALADTGHAVLVIDLDAQACATFSLGIDPEDLPPQTVDFLLDDLPSSEGSAQMRSAIRTTDEGFSLLPATLSLASADVSLADRPARERTLSRILDEIRDTFDVIVIDCSPSLGLTTINALVAADDVLVPFKCETLSHRGLGQLMESIDEVKRWSNPDLRVAGIVPTMFDGRTAHAKAVLADIGPRYGVRVFEPIPRSIRFAEAPAVGRTILATAPDSPGARAYRQLAEDISGM
ncbi:MAG: ParA family protein [Actinobacteria bacterium]|nr:ParA family protein [Candidatus Nanopelagicales bacterium]NDG95346.1 ParA family protein [Actinomycetota bacterium]NDH14290.1 ParA family protein [Actinomycetota bacterium]NKB91281.1 AAA family ATPase [Candidatus Nanopelagicales bacterium]